MNKLSLSPSMFNNLTDVVNPTSGLPAMPMLPSNGMGSIESYISAVNQMPMLSAIEEKELAERLAKFNDLEAAKKLVLSHLRVVVSIARQYKGYGLAHADLIQEGNIGLMKAVRRFDLTQGVRLVSYAIYWIKAEIHEFILKNWRLVKIASTKPQRKLFFNLRSNKPTLDAMSPSDIANLAKALDVKPEEVREMEVRLGGRDIQIDMENDEDGHREPALWLADSRLEPTQVLSNNEELQLQQVDLMNALDSLDARSQRIVHARWLAPQENKDSLTLHDLASELNISAERVRQIEVAALKKLRSVLNPH